MSREGILRPANQGDIKLLFDWANDPVTRMYSFSTDFISWEQHEKWFAAIMEDVCRIQYIYEYQGAAVGQIRLTIEGEAAEEGFSVAPEARGMGHGVSMLRLLYEEVRKRHKGIKKLYARVKPENIASQKTFIKSGHIETKRTGDYILYELTIE